MPFLSIFRKDKESSPSTPSSTFSRARSRPSFASSKRASSPPPQLADISPQSDLSYVLPELDEIQVSRPTSPDKVETITKRGLLRRKAGSALATPNTRHTPTPTTSPPRAVSAAPIIGPSAPTPTNINTNLHSDSDDDPLVPPPPRASVFSGFSYSEADRPRAQSVPEESERPRPPRPQSHPHEMAKKMKKDGSASKGLFGWRTKKEAVAINTSVEPSESTFSLKSFRHVGPPSPGVMPSESTASLAQSSLVVTGNDSPTTGTSSVSTARPIPGRSTPVGRERVNSTSSEGMMAAGLFRQAARRSSTNLVDDVAEPIRSRMRDLEKRPPPTRSWAEDSAISSGSERATGPRKSAPDTSSRKLPLENRPRKSMADVQSTLDDDEPPSPSPFAGRLGENGRTSPFSTRSESGHVPRLDYSMYGARSDGGIRSGSKLGSKLADSSRVTSPSSPTKPILSSRIFSDSPAQVPSGLPNPRPGPQGYTGPRATSPTKPRPSSPEKSRASPPSPNKPRVSAPAATRPTRSPIRSTIPTKTNDGPSLKSGGRMHRRQGSGSSQSSIQASRSALGHGRNPNIGQASVRSASVDALAYSRQPTDVFSHTRQPSVEVLSHTRRPSGFEVISRPKSPGPAAAVDPPRPTQTKTTDQLRQEAIEAMRNGAETRSPVERAKSPAPSVASRLTTSRTILDTEATPRKQYVPPPRMSSLAAGLVDSDTDESPEEVESESEGLGFGKSKGGQGALRGRHGKDPRPSLANGSPPTRSNSDDKPGLTRERTITQRDAPPKVGVSLVDGPVPRTRASHSTSAISAAATARNSAALAEANATNPNVTVQRPGKKHVRGGSFGAGSVSHMRMAAAGTDTDEDEDEESEESSEDDAPLNTLAPARRPGSAASTVASIRPGPGPRPSAPQSRATAPLISIPGVTSPPPPRPPRMNRVPGVGVTRNSSLRGSRSVEDLGRKPVTLRPGPRPFAAASPPSSTGDSSSGKAPLTPRDGSEAGRGRSDEARRRERRRSEAKKSVELGNVINGPGPFDDDDQDAMSMHHSQLGHTMGMMGMGWNQSGFYPPGGAGFPTSQSMPFMHPQVTGPLHPQMTGPQPIPMGFMPPPPPPGASEAYLQAHYQAMMIAKQTYLSAVAQQAMAAATEQWERSSNMGSSVYGGSQMSMNMGMMPMMNMYAGSSYAASAYEGSVAGWGSASAYGGPSSRSVYGGGGGARSEFGGGVKYKSNRPRGKTQTAGSDAQPARREPVPPSTWANRRKAGI
ncbi:unnamed protein product [Rhizoctonia solani]|nr:unnamed protein product [Rhizoctonia solani]